MSLDKENLQNKKEMLSQIKTKMGVYTGHLENSKENGSTLLKQELVNRFYASDDYDERLDILRQIEEMTGVKNTDLRMSLDSMNKEKGPRL